MEGFHHGERGPYNRQSLQESMGFPPSSDVVLKLTTPRLSPRQNQKFSGGFRRVSALEPEVVESSEFYVVIDEIRRWSILSEGKYQRFVSSEDGVTVLNE